MEREAILESKIEVLEKKLNGLPLILATAPAKNAEQQWKT
jgi:hypothetical protein